MYAVVEMENYEHGEDRESSKSWREEEVLAWRKFWHAVGLPISKLSVSFIYIMCFEYFLFSVSRGVKTILFANIIRIIHSRCLVLLVVVVGFAFSFPRSGKRSRFLVT